MEKVSSEMNIYSGNPSLSGFLKVRKEILHFPEDDKWLPFSDRPLHFSRYDELTL